MNRFLRLAWALMVLILVGSLLWTIDDLPNRIPTHFNGAGAPNGWSSKSTFFWTWLLTIAVANIWVVVFPWLSRWLTSEKNRKYLSMPNKDHWLSDPELRAYAMRVLETTFLVTIILSDVILMMAFRSIYGYSTTHVPHPIHWSLFVFLGAAVVFALVYPLMALRKTAGPASSQTGGASGG
ncbi:MAG: DUF1648 domain-containing protein [Deltaproteobacteria bacterium]|nr:DUF1648 domain-containing protein [Deltaproteobacteria bacterium]